MTAISTTQQAIDGFPRLQQFLSFVINYRKSKLIQINTLSLHFQQEQAFSNEDVRNNILGFTIGVDVTVKAFVVSVRASWDFQNNNKNGVSTTPRYKNQLLQLTIGFRI